MKKSVGWKVILGISYDKLHKNGHKKLKRKDAFKILSRGVRIDRDMAKTILKDLEDLGLIENKNRGIVFKKG